MDKDVIFSDGVGDWCVAPRRYLDQALLESHEFLTVANREEGGGPGGY